jgi:transcriptional regulator
MYESLEKQIKVLALLRHGKKPSDIQKEMRIPDSTISYIRQNTPDNMSRLIGLLRLAVESDALEKQQMQELKTIVAKLKS